MTTPLTQLLARGKELREKATPGPWKRGLIAALFRYNRKSFFWDDDYDSDEDRKANTPQEGDAEFIVHSSNTHEVYEKIIQTAVEALEKIYKTNHQPNHKDGPRGTYWDMTETARDAVIKINSLAEKVGE